MEITHLANDKIINCLVCEGMRRLRVDKHKEDKECCIFVENCEYCILFGMEKL